MKEVLRAARACRPPTDICTFFIVAIYLLDFAPFLGPPTRRLSCSASTYDTLELEKINPEQVDACKASALRAVELPERTKGQPSAEKRLVKFLGLFPPEKRTSSGKSTYPIGPGVAGVVITTRRRQSGKPIADGWPIGRPHRQPGRPVGGGKLHLLHTTESATAVSELG